MTDKVQESLSKHLGIDEEETEVYELTEVENKEDNKEISPLSPDVFDNNGLAKLKKELSILSEIENKVGMETYAKAMMIKITDYAINGHNEIQSLVPQVDESRAARLAEVAAQYLNIATTVTKNILTHEEIKNKQELDSHKLELKKKELNNEVDMNNDAITVMTQKDILEELKNIMKNEEEENSND